MSAIDTIRKNGQITISVPQERREHFIAVLLALKHANPLISFSELIVNEVVRGTHEQQLRDPNQTGTQDAGSDANATGR